MVIEYWRQKIRLERDGVDKCCFEVFSTPKNIPGEEIKLSLASPYFQRCSHKLRISCPYHETKRLFLVTLLAEDNS